ncbi:hypothetical protein CBR_g36778 [Chara braunii]|uniref:Uncharacterized protein n=1 Tax=Chara braunii TaxID=69332 RepID=A0A388LLS3_CHABU|nr:hypothetical protein CBR_g36778 [Chara braunii]|eukprot:GBG83162.1 hypothetical protein CBR_g36778 [Chara braunii]
MASEEAVDGEDAEDDVRRVTASEEAAFVNIDADEQTPRGDVCENDDEENTDEVVRRDEASEKVVFVDLRKENTEDVMYANACDHGGDTMENDNAESREEARSNDGAFQKCFFDMFGKRPSGEGIREMKQTSLQEVRRGVFSKLKKSEKTPYNLGKRSRNLRVYNKKANYHVNMKRVEEVLKESCCKAACYKKFRAEDVYYIRETFRAMKQPEQVNFLLSEMRAASYFSDEGELAMLRVTLNGIKVCTRAWGKLYGCSTTHVASVRATFKDGVHTYEHRNKGAGGLSVSSLYILSWLHEYFRYNTESMPNSNQFHLSSTLLRKDVYEFFEKECASLYSSSIFPSSSWFMTIWRDHCPKVLIPTLKRFSVCSQCL